MSNEPLIHSHITDCLDEDHPFTKLACNNTPVVDCDNCNEMLWHYNECMQTWVETGKGNYCLRCWISILSETGQMCMLDDEWGLSKNQKLNASPTRREVKRSCDEFFKTLRTRNALN